MTDSNSTHIGGDVNITGGDFVGRDKITNIYPPGSSPAELTPDLLAAAESRYRAQVAEHYNRLGFAGLGIGDTRLSDVALDDVFVRLTLTVEKIVREPIPPEEWALEREREARGLNPFRRGQKEEDERPRERTVITQEPITLGDALTQHALIVGEPGAGKSTLLRWLAVTFAAGRQREVDRLGPQTDADRLPLLVELGRLPEAYLQADSRETPNWKVFLPEYLTKQSLFDDTPATLLEQALTAGRCLLLCDGLDEIADLSARRRLADSLAEYARNSQNRLVLSSRPAGVSGSEGVLGPRFQRLTIQRFTSEDVRRFFGFLYAQDIELATDEQAKEADAIFRAVEGAPKTLELATTPLLATLLFSLWNENGYLPERRVELYKLCCRMLIESWEAQHDVAYTGVLADIGWERHLRLLEPLAYAIHNGGQRTDAPASELIPVLARAMQAEGLASPPSATLEAEKFLRTVSLRSGLLQFLGADRYGFPHLTFQEYLTARHIAAQPDPDYIDLVMVDLHKAWWREVHLLVIGHLGSGREGAEKASKLLRMVLYRYPPPLQLLRSKPFGNPLAAQIDWQLEERLAWVLAREFTFAATGFFECSLQGVNAQLRHSLTFSAQQLLLQIILEPGRQEDGDASPLAVAVRTLTELGLAPKDAVSALVSALDNPDWQVRDTAVWNLGELGHASGEVLAALVSALSDSDWQVRQDAADSLGLLGEASGEVLSALTSALGDTNYDVRQAVVGSLGKLSEGSEQALVALVSMLSTSDWTVRLAAAGQLGQLEKASWVVVSALVSALSDTNHNVRQAAASSLGQLSEASGEILAALVSALGDSDSQVRQAAMGSLGELGKVSTEVIPMLVAALSNPDLYIRSMAAESLVRLGQTSIDIVAALVAGLGDSDFHIRSGAAGSLVKLGQSSADVIPALLAIINVPDVVVRRMVVDILGELGQASVEVVAALSAALRDKYVYVASRAAVSLVRLGQISPSVVLVLVVSLEDWDSDVRRAVVDSLGKVGKGKWLGLVIPALVKALGDKWVRRFAARSLGELGQVSDEVVAALVATLDNCRNDSDGHVAEAVAVSLVQLGQSSVLVPSLRDSRHWVRTAVAGSLGRLEQVSREVLAALIARLSDSSPDVRQAAASSLVSLGQVFGEVVSALVVALDDSEWTGREAAASSLGQLKIEDETQLRTVLIALNRRLHDRDDDVRRAALTAIRRLLDGRQIPGYRWVPIRERRERARRRRIFWYWVLGISLAVLVAWVAAGLTTYLSLDEFWVRFVGALAALVALAAGAVQVLGWFRRPPWDR